MGLLDLLTSVDPFLSQTHSDACQLWKRHTYYLSKTIFEKVVEILGKVAEGIIVSEVKKAKYFSISLDSTTDITPRTSFVSQ